MAKYKNPRAFKQALTDRIKRRAKARGMLFNRYRQLVLFDRFLARVYEACSEAVVLKGGYVMELRLGRARTTKDVDMRGTGDIDDLLGRIAEEAKKEGSDFLTFDVADARDMEEMLGEQVIYEGRRVRVQARGGILSGNVLTGIGGYVRSAHWPLAPNTIDTFLAVVAFRAHVVILTLRAHVFLRVVRVVTEMHALHILRLREPTRILSILSAVFVVVTFDLGGMIFARSSAMRRQRSDRNGER